MFAEASLTIYENVVIDYQKGTPVSVEFDFLKLWEFRKILGNDFDPALLHFYHVHPPSFGTQMSSKDENCIRGLSMAFNYPVAFSILVFIEKFVYYGQTYCYLKSMNKIINAENDIELLSLTMLNLLKNLSEG